MVKFCDLNRSLVDKVKALGIQSVCADYFLEACRTPRSVLMTASNPNFTMGGGLDYLFEKNYPHVVQFKQARGGGMERIGNIIFAITVDNDYKATPDTIKQALIFALEHVYEGETLLVSGIGTGIGGLLEDEFVRIMKEVMATPTALPAF